MAVEIIGIDHIYLAVSDLQRSEKFYDIAMPLLGFRKSSFAIGGAPHVQYYNRHFGYVLRPARPGAPPHDSYHPGLHHLCFRVEDAAAVAEVSERLNAAGIACSAERHFPEYAPDYHAVFFNDPDGMRLEVTNYRQERRDRFDQWEQT
jgi:glyoxylase I family protein